MRWPPAIDGAVRPIREMVRLKFRPFPRSTAYGGAIKYRRDSQPVRPRGYLRDESLCGDRSTKHPIQLAIRSQGHHVRKIPCVRASLKTELVLSSAGTMSKPRGSRSNSK